MATIIEALDAYASQAWNKDWQNPAWKQFLVTGETKHLKALPNLYKRGWLPDALLKPLPAPDKMNETERRFLQAALAAGLFNALGQWLAQSLPLEKSQEVQFAKACSIAGEIGCSQLALAIQVAQYVRPLRDAKVSPTMAGKFLLALDDQTFHRVAAEICQNDSFASELTALFLANAPERWEKWLETIHQPGEVIKTAKCVWTLALESDAKLFSKAVARAFEIAKDWHPHFKLGAALYKVDPSGFGGPMEKICLERLLTEDGGAKKRFWHQAKQSAEWLVVNIGHKALPHLKGYFSGPLDADAWTMKNQSEYKNEVLTQTPLVLGRDAIPLFEACFATPQPEVQLNALKLWIALKTEADTEPLAARFRQAFASEDGSYVSRAVRLAGDWNPAVVENELWPLLAHKSRPVRDAAAGTLAKLGESRLPKAKELWTARRADARIAATNWLHFIATPAAAAELKSRLEDEDADDVRDAVLLALDKISGGKTEINSEEVCERIKKTMAKLKGPPVDWLDVKNLPAAKLKDGSPLTNDWLLYLLHRQSRVKEMRADIEARPVFEMLDRHTTGDLALALAHAFFGSQADADDRWVMAFAALIGNDRLVPVFSKQVKEWADNMRGKLAEYAVQALALLGTDAALLAVDAMAIRYRSKNKNIGKAATEAFAAAAAARGLTVEELGDLVVPWLGFKPGEPRVVDAGKAKMEARISNDFKIILRDAATNKKVAKLPDSVSAETKNEFKELSAGLKEAVKSQLLRMETLMVRQFRWPSARWQELYLRHPLLLPFAQRLVWGAYGPAGKLIATFRALEDQSLTDGADELFTLPAESEIGVVHPLELSEEVRQAWLKHLADYDIVPPFAQIERPVVIVQPEQKQMKFGNEVEETKLNGLTFKGRAERLGWARGSVCDAGCINFYLKSFPAAGVDVFVATEGMYVGIDMYSDITLGKMFFVKHGSVQIGSYVYDEPGNQQDVRLVPFGEVPPIAFSEAMGDLKRIAGKDKTSTQETTE